jgi:hypothetical protein
MSVSMKVAQLDTPKSMDMLRNIKEAKNIDKAGTEAFGWI